MVLLKQVKCVIADFKVFASSFQKRPVHMTAINAAIEDMLIELLKHLPSGQTAFLTNLKS